MTVEEIFVKNYPEFCYNGKPLSPYWDLFSAGYETLGKENAELKSIADFQTSSNMDRYFQLKRSKEKLSEAKEIIKKLLKTPQTIHQKDVDGELCSFVNTEYSAIVKTAEQFLKEV